MSGYMRLRAIMNGINKYFYRRERAVEAKEPEKNGDDLNKWTGTEEAPRC